MLLYSAIFRFKNVILLSFINIINLDDKSVGWIYCFDVYKYYAVFNQFEKDMYFTLYAWIFPLLVNCLKGLGADEAFPSSSSLLFCSSEPSFSQFLMCWKKHVVLPQEWTTLYMHHSLQHYHLQLWSGSRWWSCAHNSTAVEKQMEGLHMFKTVEHFLTGLLDET